MNAALERALARARQGKAEGLTRGTFLLVASSVLDKEAAAMAEQAAKHEYDGVPLPENAPESKSNGQTSPEVLEKIDSESAPVTTTVAVIEQPATPPDRAATEEEKPVATEPGPSIAVTEPAADELTDDQLVEEALIYLGQGMSSDDAVKKLIADFDGVDQADAEKYVRLAVERERDEEKADADESRRIAADAVDEAKAAVDKAKDEKKKADRVFADWYLQQKNKRRPTTVEDDERFNRIMRERLEAEEEPEEKFDIHEGELFPECPAFPGALTTLARALFPSLPLEFKQWGLITRWGLMRSGIDTFGIEKHIQPRFYSVLVCYPNRGKTACINESRNAMEIIYAMVKNIADSKPRVCTEPENIPSVDSGQFFADEFSNMVKAAKGTYDKGGCLDLAGKMMLDPDELGDVFEKGRTTQGRVSTMFNEMLKLHSGNRTGSGTKGDGKNVVTNAHLAILAGTTVQKYPMLWTGTGGKADGLVSRFIPITTNASQVRPIPLPSDLETAQKMYERLARLAQLPGQTIILTDDAAELLIQWWGSFDNGKESATRVLETVKQLLIVLAVTNLPVNHTGTTVRVGVDLMAPAIKFGEYVIAARERLNPGDAWSHVQAQENAIMEWAKNHTSKSDPKSLREFRRGIHPERLPGGLGTFKLAWRNCIDTEVLKVRSKNHTSTLYSL